MRLEPEGVTVIELAPGIDLKRDVLAQAEFPLRIAAKVRDDGCDAFFVPGLLGLTLRPAVGAAR